MPARGLLAHLDARSAPAPSSLARVRRQRHQARPPILLPQQVQAILDGCAVTDLASGDWAGNLRDRLLFAVLAETGARLGEVLGLAINDFVLGRSGTAFIDIVPREDLESRAVGLPARQQPDVRPRRLGAG